MTKARWMAEGLGQMKAGWPLVFLLAIPNCNPPEQKAPSCPPCAEASQKVEEQPQRAPSLSGVLKVIERNGESRVVTANQLAELAPPENIVSEDPNYRAKKSFVALPLAPLLLKLFEREELDESTVRLVASDGYTVQLDAGLLLAGDAYIAVGEGEPGRFSPIGPQASDAGPFYLVWKGEDYVDDKKFPRPWGLVSIQILDPARGHKHTRPEDGFAGNTAAEKGAELFETLCIRCHSINREGGRVGPDLNVPQNIMAYRPEEQVRAYIRNPQEFRYSNMPAHPDLTQKDLDALIAYLKVMGENQHDPGAD
jgi:mono/diheme cytochrome c family protein